MQPCAVARLFHHARWKSNARAAKTTCRAMGTPLPLAGRHRLVSPSASRTCSCLELAGSKVWSSKSPAFWISLTRSLEQYNKSVRRCQLCFNFNFKGGVKVPEKWTGRLVGRMHNHQITVTQLAEYLGFSRCYCSLILSSKRNPPGIREKMEAAVSELIKEKEAEPWAKTKSPAGSTTGLNRKSWLRFSALRFCVKW